jgi:hypothetical protein
MAELRSLSWSQIFVADIEMISCIQKGKEIEKLRFYASFHSS